MKYSILLTVFSTLFIFTNIAYIACNKDACKGVFCQNSGTCSGGTCSCPDGFSGKRCEIKEPCKNIVCLNGGNCVDGTCICAAGYEGNSCDELSREKFRGHWDVSESDFTTGNSYSYTIKIDRTSGIMVLEIDNFWNTFNDVAVTIDKDSIFIDKQVRGDWEFEGHGILIRNPRHIRMYYRAKNISNGSVEDYGFAEGQPSIWKRSI